MNAARSLAVLSVLFASSTLPAAAPESIEQSWNRRIQETVDALKAGEAEKARVAIHGVLQEMATQANPGKALGSGLGMGLTLRGLAHAALGDESRAAWDWQLAQQLHPALEALRLDEFGAAGAVLERHRLANDPRPEVPSGMDLPRGGTRVELVKRGKTPTYVQRARDSRWQGTLKVSAIVDEQGRVTHPRIETPTDEFGVLFGVCEFLAEGEFKSATLDGRAIASRYEFTMKFSLT